MSDSDGEIVDGNRFPSECSEEPRKLSSEEIARLDQQNLKLVNQFTQKKLETDSKKNWDLFYKRNTTNFFKDRHWTIIEFREIFDDVDKRDVTVLLEIGCGVGNFIFPLLKEVKNLRVYACDFSERAINFVQSHSSYDPERITAFVGDVTSPRFVDNLKGNEVDIVTLIFVMSALHPSNFQQCADNIKHCLKPNGVVIIRDYAINDMTQIRFKPGNKISDNFYMRQDGTRSYFFSLADLRNMFSPESFKEDFCYYVHCRTVNKKESVDVPRTFVQAKFVKY